MKACRPVQEGVHRQRPRPHAAIAKMGRCRQKAASLLALEPSRRPAGRHRAASSRDRRYPTRPHDYAVEPRRRSAATARTRSSSPPRRFAWRWDPAPSPASCAREPSSPRTPLRSRLRDAYGVSCEHHLPPVATLSELERQVYRELLWRPSSIQGARTRDPRRPARHVRPDEREKKEPPSPASRSPSPAEPEAEAANASNDAGATARGHEARGAGSDLATWSPALGPLHRGDRP
jgi:hypothetical protein